MNRHCILGLLVGLALASLAFGAQAQQYGDPGYDDRYQGEQDYYDDFDRRDERYEDIRGERRVIRCESHDRRTNYCEIDPRGGVRLIRQLSNAHCSRGDTWGVNARGIWVTQGCRAEFEVGVGGYGRVFRCESNDNRTRYCNADTRYGIRIVRQLSRSACIEGSTWGVTRDGVWVSRGCRAEFSDRYYRRREAY
jgi:molybdenum cofactor biosynthesis enzyme MoaA